MNVLLLSSQHHMAAARERSSLSYGRLCWFVFETEDREGGEGPTVVVLRQTERNQPFIVLFLTQQRLCKEKRSSCLKDKVCLAENRHLIDTAMTK